MSTGVKIVIGILVLAVIGGLSYWIYKTFGGSGGGKYRISYIQKPPDGKLILNIDVRPGFNAIKVGQKVTITGTDFDGQYNVEATWQDSSGRLGAIYIIATTKEPEGGDSSIAFQGKAFIIA